MRQARRVAKRPQGRPRRTDDPRRLTVNLPGELRRWLRIYAVTVERDMGDIVAEALIAYRADAIRTRRASRKGERQP